MTLRSIGLIGRSVLIESIRRREIYAIVLVACLLIGAVMTLDFFALEGLTKFYREIALRVMSMTTALTVIVLSARQLPREFENRTIYPLLAKPVSRLTFLIGKLLGVQLAAVFCFALFMVVYVVGALYLHGSIPWALFGQYLYLQMLSMLVLATLAFWLSMVLNLDAAITLAVIFYLTAATYTSITTYIYELLGPVQRAVLVVLNYALPQLALFDLSEKTVHDEVWPPLSFATMAELTLYGGTFAAVYFGLALFSFRRRPL